MNIPVVYDDKVLQQKHEEIFKVLKIDKTKKEMLDSYKFIMDSNVVEEEKKDELYSEENIFVD